MRRLIVAIVCSVGLGGSAFSADFAADPVLAPATPSAANYDWTGFYIGGTIGYGWGNSQHCDNTGCSFAGPENDPDGVVGGVTVGYNIQYYQWVFGIEADYSGSGMEGSSGSIPGYGCGGGADICATEINQFGTIRGRVGYAVGNLLPYVTGGVAITHLEGSLTPISDSTTEASAVVGGGVEYAINSNWSAKIEYLHIFDPGTFEFSPACAAPGCGIRDNDFDVARFGINYRF